MSTAHVNPPVAAEEWRLPSKGRAGMLALIIGESALFSIFVVAYVFYIGKSLTGPTPAQVLEIPIIGTICLLSSSFTIWRAEHAIASNRMQRFGIWLAATITLGVIFIIGTALEWQKLIVKDGLTISTNLFGTTFYSLVGLHATHVVIGLALLSTVFMLTLAGRFTAVQSERFLVIALYWHFVDVVWVVVFTVVYLVGR